MTLAGRTALVTGGSRGIGRAIVWALAKAGARVAFVYRSSSEAAQQLVEELELDQREVLAIQADVAQADVAESVVGEVLEAWEQIDILVNNAGIVRDGLLATMDTEQWQSVIDTNLGSVYHFTHAVTRPMMSQRHGRIINISSVASHFGNPGQANYAASKGGIEGMTRCLAAELGRRGITVNAIAPGFIETDMTEAIRNAAEKEIIKHISVRRLGLPEDVAAAVAFLAGDEASYITGHVLVIDGGLTLGGI